jgi:PLP dependent protein
MTVVQKLIDNLAEVRGCIAEAARRSGRSPDEVTLVAVTKYVSSDLAQQLVAAGCHDLGENRPQELWAKAEALKHMATPTAGAKATEVRPSTDASLVRWHLIGHLQRNKIARTLPWVALIHSVDSLRLLEAIDQAAASLRHRISVLLEVNISGDASKHGFQPGAIEPLLLRIAALSWLEPRGLMGMASREGDLTHARREFGALRELRDRLQRVAPPNMKLDELSMGMSGDYEAAIEEGATLVRIGSALFEGIVQQ